MAEFKVGDRVRVLVGDYAGQEGELTEAGAAIGVRVGGDRVIYFAYERSLELVAPAQTKAPEPLPETLPAGTRYNTFSGDPEYEFEILETWAKRGRAYCVGKRRRVHDREEFSDSHGVITPERIDWPSYYTALEASKQGGQKDWEQVVVEKAVELMRDTERPPAEDPPLCPRCGNGHNDPETERCNYCGTTARQIRQLMQERGMPSCGSCGRPTGKEEHSQYGVCVECYEPMPSRAKLAAPLDSRIATALSDLDRKPTGSGTGSWPEQFSGSSYED